MRKWWLTMGIVIGCTLVVLAPLAWYFLQNINAFGGHDWDWFFSHYEAVRQSIVVYHQFPWWNPWSAGGAPLFIDPQVGVFSITTVFVLVFGTLWGIKLSLLAHYALGFWGMYMLLRRLQRQPSRSIPLLLSVLWIYSGFTIFHSIAGHVSFLQYLLAPFGIIVLLYRDASYWWLRAGIFWGIFILGVPHYIVIQLLVVLVPLCCFELVRCPRDERKKLLRDGALFGMLVLMICGPRVWASATYLQQFPRQNLIETVTNIYVYIVALFHTESISGEANKHLPNWEYYAFVGISFALYYCIVLFQELRKNIVSLWLVVAKKISGFAKISTFKTVESVPDQQRFWFYFLLGFVCMVIGFGPFSPYAPYTLIQKLPLLSTLQVPTRWFGWSVFFGIIAAGCAVIPKPKIIQLLLIGAIAECIFANLIIQPDAFSYSSTAQQLPHTSTFEQYSGYPGPLTGLNNMYFALRNGYGEVRAYEPIISYDVNRPTDRCGINEGCPFISGGTIVSWSPNRLALQGVPGQRVHLNMNNSVAWRVNNRPIAATKNIFDNTQDVSFVFPTNGKAILTFMPSYRWSMYASLCVAGASSIVLMSLALRRRKQK